MVQDYLESQRAPVDAELGLLLPAADAYPVSVHRAMRHSVFAGGKRLRPLLALETARLFAEPGREILRLGCALEMIHTYSLIHDDLPALDNDDLRRGKPTCHKAFGEATAILAGDALLTLAFETLALPAATTDGERAVPPGARLRVIQELAHAVGTCGGMVAGQVVDLESNAAGAGPGEVNFIHSAKTGAFIRMSVRAGAIYADASEPDVERVTCYGEKIGLAFQIADDLLDVLGTERAMGKAVGKDGSKATFPAVFGIEESQAVAARLVKGAIDSLAPYGERARRLREIAGYLIARNC
jgi:geranylgeranyl diphosphate synthase type II